MESYISIAALGRFEKLPITSTAYETLRNARDYLSDLLKFEQAYAVLLINYKSLERAGQEVVLHNMTSTEFSYESVFDWELNINAKIINLLSSARLYLDTAPKLLSRALPDQEESQLFIKEFFSKEYDASFEYRFAEALRNYVQHYGMPIHTFSQNSKWLEDDRRVLEFSVDFITTKSVLEADGKFKKSVLDETPDSVSLKHTFREYMSRLSVAHCNARNSRESLATSARSLLSAQIEEYRSISGTTALGLCCFKGHERFNLMLDWDDVRLGLVKRNKSLSNLAVRRSAH
ncbi:MAG: hypothetical protein ACOH1P_12650 [Lysobacter sp.]